MWLCQAEVMNIQQDNGTLNHFFNSRQELRTYSPENATWWHEGAHMFSLYFVTLSYTTCVEPHVL